MFLTKHAPPPSPAPPPEPTPEPSNLIEFRFKLSGDTLTKLLSLALSIALGSAGVLGYLQSQTPSVPIDSSPTTTGVDP